MRSTHQLLDTVRAGREPFPAQDHPSNGTALNLLGQHGDGLFCQTRPVYCPMKVPPTHLLLCPSRSGPQSSEDTPVEGLALSAA
jgi:hypothetical protein